MIVYPHTNLFDCLSPILENGEEEILFSHPTENIKVNQVGWIYLGDNYYIQNKNGLDYICKFTNVRANRKSVGTRLRITLECFEGIKIPNKQILFRNGNPLDYRHENLVLISSLQTKERKQIQKVNSRFKSHSAETLKRIEKKYLKRGIESSLLYEILRLPKWLIEK